MSALNPIAAGNRRVSECDILLAVIGKGWIIIINNIIIAAARARATVETIKAAFRG